MWRSLLCIDLVIKGLVADTAERRQWWLSLEGVGLTDCGLPVQTQHVLDSRYVCF